MKRLRFIDPYSAARVAAMLTAGVAIVCGGPVMTLHSFISFRNGHHGQVLKDLGASLELIIVTVAIVFLFVVIGCRIYNWYAKKWGGIEVDLW